MAAVQGGVCFDKIAEKWYALAQRRLAYIRELERNGRWKRYSTDEQFASSLRDAERVVTLWAKLAGYQGAQAKSDFRPAA